MKIDTAYIQSLVETGGPASKDYPVLEKWIRDVYFAFSNGVLNNSDLERIRSSLGDALSQETLQGFAYTKPHGYAGDFEIIDRIYSQHITNQPNLSSWDIFYHHQPATKAVRNRKAYFHRLLDHFHSVFGNLNVLNVGSGPGRCMFEWLKANQSQGCMFHCIDLDPKAISYATHLNADFEDQLIFERANVLRWSPGQERYHLVWAAGIFDYFNDRLFRSLVRRLLPSLLPGGELVIGNFSTKNPSKPYMEVFGDWALEHRSEQQLIDLAIQSGACRNQIKIGSEPEGINLFLHIRT